MTADTTDELRAAAESIDAASDRAPDDAADRLGGFAERVRKMADAERGPDHGALARLEHGLQDVRADLDDEGAAAVDAALDHVRAYRATVEGV